MVNRFHRLRCLTCRLRKVKCDEARPACQRCVRSGLQCQGYDHIERFVNAFGEADQPRFPKQKLPGPKQAVVFARPRSPILIDNDETYISYMFSEFTSLHSRSAPALECAMPDLRAAPSSICGPLRTNCLRAVALSYFGKRNRSQEAHQRGFRLYQHALANLRELLGNLDVCYTTDLLKCMLCLAFFENINCTTPTAWLAHYKGFARAVELGGPCTFTDRVRIRILRLSRLQIALICAIERTPCFLARNEWQTLMSLEGTTDDVGVADRLYDIFILIPGTLAQLDNIRKVESDKRNDLASFCQQLSYIITALGEWYDGLSILARTVGHNISLATDIRTVVGSFEEIAAMALHHAILLALLEPCELVNPSLHAMPTDILPYDPENLESEGMLGYENKARHLAARIVQLAHLVLFGPKAATLALHLMFPLQMAAKFVHPGQAGLLRTVQGILTEVHGFELGRNRDWDEVLSRHGK